jgi:hypothetical protein
VVRIFGPNSLAEKSLLPCTKGEVLGWYVDLELEVIRPNDKAIRKLMFAFFTVDLNAKTWPLQRCQILASLAERYSLVLSGMKNFVHPLHSLCGNPVVVRSGKSTNQATKNMRVTSSAKFAVEMWRMVAISLFADPFCFAVPLRSLIKVNSDIPEFFFISDAGPNKAGLAVYDRVGTMLFFSSYAWPFIRNDECQNAKEFLAFLLTLVSAILILGIRDCRVQWIGDNFAALTWVKKERCQSHFAQLSFIAFSILSLRRNINVVEVVHRPGILMGAIDALSRDFAHDLDPALYHDIESYSVINNLALVCDPLLLLEAELESHHSALQTMFELLRQLF